MEPTVTDANLALGRLNPGQIAGGAVQLSLDLAGDALDRLAAQLPGFDRTRLAAGIIRLVNADMAKVLRIVSLERGHDPRQFTLVAFGGAGPLHACALAAELAIPRIIVPPHPGLFSAWGLLVSDQVHTTLQSLLMLADQCEPAALEGVYKKLEEEGTQALSIEGKRAGAISFRHTLELRYAGQSFELTVPVPSALNKATFQETLEAFHIEHARVYGYAARDIPVELVTARVDAIAQLPRPALAEERPDQPGQPAEATAEERLVFFEEAADFIQTPVYQRERLRAGNLVDGPAIIEQYDTTTLLPPGWQAAVDQFTNLIIERA